MPIQKRFKKPPVISTSALTPIVGPRLLTPKSAAAYLSMSIDVVRDMIQHRRIPYVQNGRRYLIDRLAGVYCGFVRQIPKSSFLCSLRPPAGITHGGESPARTATAPSPK